MNNGDGNPQAQLIEQITNESIQLPLNFKNNTLYTLLLLG